MPLITENQLEEIVKLSESVPEEYRQKCFELLLTNSLELSSSHSIPQTKPITDEVAKEPPTNVPFVLPIDARAFLSQYGLDESVLWSFFLAEGAETRHIYKLKTTKKTQAQIQHALMMSLEHGIATGRFEVAVEDLRIRCKDEKCYDTNFTKSIKSYAQYFKQVEDVETLVLSPDGKSALADLLEELGKNG